MIETFVVAWMGYWVVRGIAKMCYPKTSTFWSDFTVAILFPVWVAALAYLFAKLMMKEKIGRLKHEDTCV